MYHNKLYTVKQCYSVNSFASNLINLIFLKIVICLANRNIIPTVSLSTEFQNFRNYFIYQSYNSYYSEYVLD